MSDQDSSAGRIALEWARKGMRAYELERAKLSKRPTIIAETETLRYIKCDKEAPLPVVDGLIHTMGIKQDAGVYILTATLECRTRFGLTNERLRDEYGNRLMLSKSKLDAGYALSRSLGKEFWMLQVLVDSNCYWVSRLTDAKGNFLSDWYEEDTNCSKTINSTERVTKPTIFVDVAKSKKFSL